MKRLIIGSRGSDLALTQTNDIARRLRDCAPGVEVDVEIISTKGDRIRDVPLAKIGGKGLFTKELEAAMLDGRTDLAVHSLKDLPTELPEGLCIAAIPERENPCDALISADGKKLHELRPGARVGTSSLRRKVQLLAKRPDLEIVDLRGNVPTRIQKIKDEGLDAIVLASAGLNRLGLGGVITEILAPDVMLPAVGQGALGIETRSGDTETFEIIARLNDPKTAAEATAERALLRAMGGGCQVPIGALAQVNGDTLTLVACVCGIDGKTVLRARVTGPATQAEALGEEAAAQLKRGGGALLMAKAVAAETGEPLPLAGKRVVITRAQTQASGLAQHLEAAGAEIIEFPLLEVHPVAAPEIGEDAAYDWLVFTSANGVHYFAEALAAQGRAFTEFRNASICAIGPATATAVQERGLSVSLTPERYVAEALVETFLALEEGLAGKRFLIPRGNLARPFLPDALRDCGAEVTESIVYETRPAQVTQERIDALFAERPGVVTFASSSAVQYLEQALGEEAFTRLKEEADFASIGPITSETAAKHGVRIAVEAQEHDIPGLVRALAEYYNKSDEN